MPIFGHAEFIESKISFLFCIGKKRGVGNGPVRGGKLNFMASSPGSAVVAKLVIWDFNITQYPS